jgi:rhodanese-related sulfurtransferase
MQELTTFISFHPALSAALLLILILLMGVEFLRAKRQTFNIHPIQLTRLINHQQAVVIDIRPQEAYRKGHIIDAQAMTPSEIRENSKKLEKSKARPIILVCNTGIESQKIAAQLLKRGYNAYSLSGGMRAWTEAQMPLIKE